MADTALKEKVSGLEQMMMELAYESMKTDMALRNLSSEMKEFKKEMKEFKGEINNDIKVLKEKTSKSKEDIRDDTKSFTAGLSNDTENFKKEMNDKWIELANKMGTIVEDIVAPGLKGVGGQIFRN